MSTEGQFTYSRGTDGCDETFDIYDPSGEIMVSIHFWEREAGAEADAKLIVHRLNMHNKLLAALRTVVEMEYDRDSESRNFDDERLASFAAIIAEATGEDE